MKVTHLIGKNQTKDLVDHLVFILILIIRYGLILKKKDLVHGKKKIVKIQS